MNKLEAIKSELAKSGAPVRWATANKSRITSVLFQWSRDKMEQTKKSEALPPETEVKISEYESLKMEMLRMDYPPRMMPVRLTPGSARPEAPANKDYEAMSKRVADAKAPIASIVDRRERQAAEYRQEYQADHLIAEYVKDRFDLVVDSSEDRFNSPVLYRAAGEVADITEGVVALFKAKSRE